MQNNQIITRFKRTIVGIMCLSIICGAIPNLVAQIKAELDSSYNDNLFRDDAYAQLFRRIRGGDYENMLIANVGIENAPAVLDWFDSNQAAMFRALDTAYRSKIDETLESIAAGGKPAKPTMRRSVTRKISFDPYQEVEFQPAFYRPNDDLQITKTETADGFEMGTAKETTKTVNGVVVTHGVAGNTKAIMVEGGQTGTEYRSVEYTEADNRAERTKMRTETTMGWKTVVATCPDENGFVHGTATMTNAVKLTITTPHTIGILSRNITTTMKVKGYVNDTAELTHYDITGTAVESISGYDRAERLDLISDPEFSDGTRSLEYAITNSKSGKPVKNEYGFTKTVGREFGDLAVKLGPGTTLDDARRVDKAGGLHAAYLAEQALQALEMARGQWQYDGCVAIKLAAPKNRLVPGEMVDVTAETVHKWDKKSVNADLRLAAATESATPDNQRGKASAVFQLTAPAKGSAGKIIVESKSRRGIALEWLDFAEEKTTKPQPPRKKNPPVAKCSGWTGKITAVKTKRTEIAKPASGRLVRQIENKEETFSVDYYVLGTPDTSQGFTNAYHSDSQMNYRAVEYRESNYAPGKMSCNNAIITTGQTQKIESLMTALSRKRITVYITSTGEEGILTFDSPEIEAERIITRTYETSCPSYNQVNSGVDRSDTLIGVPSPGFEIHFELDTESHRNLKGSKRIDNSDGSYTVVTWDLTRNCQ